MRVLEKSHEETWSNSTNSQTSNLDHVIVSNDLSIQKRYFVGRPDDTFEILVSGWIEK